MLMLFISTLLCCMTCISNKNKHKHVHSTKMYSLYKSFVFWFILGDLKREHFLSLVRATPVVHGLASEISLTWWKWRTRVKKSRQMPSISSSSLAGSRQSAPGSSALSLGSSQPSLMVTWCSSCLIHRKEDGGAKMGMSPSVTTVLKVVKVMFNKI